MYRRIGIKILCLLKNTADYFFCPDPFICVAAFSLLFGNCCSIVFMYRMCSYEGQSIILKWNMTNEGDINKKVNLGRLLAGLLYFYFMFLGLFYDKVAWPRNYLAMQNRKVSFMGWINNSTPFINLSQLLQISPKGIAWDRLPWFSTENYNL